MADLLLVLGAVLVLAVILVLGTRGDGLPPNALLFGAFVVMGAGLAFAVHSGKGEK